MQWKTTREKRIFLRETQNEAVLRGFFFNFIFNSNKSILVTLYFKIRRFGFSIYFNGFI
jgi:hypothetical protein